jgi:hypothetical protein
MLEAGGFSRIDMETPGARRTGFARKYIEAGKPVYSGSFVKASPTAR